MLAEETGLEEEEVYLSPSRMQVNLKYPALMLGSRKERLGQREHAT
jgi:hypothetical protein